MTYLDRLLEVPTGHCLAHGFAERHERSWPSSSSRGQPSLVPSCAPPTR